MDPSQVRSDLLARIQTTLAETYRRGEVDTDDGPLEIRPTGVPHANGEALRSALRTLGAKRTLETGFAFGLSGLFMLTASLENGADPLAGEPVHTAFDPTETHLWKRAGLRLFADCGASHLLRFIESRSELEMPKLIEAGERFDAIFIDGDHRFESAFADLMFAVRLVEPGGALIVDDIWMPAVRAAIDYFVTNVGLVVDRQLTPARSGAFVVLRVPAALPKRRWDHFRPFDAVQGELIGAS